MPKLLRMKRIDTIGIVDVGASGDLKHRPEIVVFKRCGDVPHKITKQEGSTMDLEQLLAELGKLTDEQKAAVLAALGVKVETKEEEAAEAVKMADDGEADEEVAKALEKSPALKAHLEKVRKSLDEQRGIANALGKRLQDVEDERLEQTMIAKARKFAGVGVEQKAMVGLLKSVHKRLDESDRNALDRVLASVSEIAKRAKLLDGIGSDGDGIDPGATSNDEIRNKMIPIAKRLQEQNPGLSFEQAMYKALQARS